MPGMDPPGTAGRRRLGRRASAVASAAAAIAGFAASPEPASTQTTAGVGWHQTPFASTGYAAWLDRAGQGAVLFKDYTDDGDPEPWVERPLLPDGTLGPEAPLDPAIVPERESVALGHGPQVIFRTPAGLVGRSGDGWRDLGDPGLAGQIWIARSNQRGDVLAGDNRGRLAVRTGGRWRRSPPPPALGDSVQGLGEDGSVVVAGTSGVDGRTRQRIDSRLYVPGSGWQRLPPITTDGPPALGGVAIDGSGVATLVYSTEGAGVRSVTLEPGTSSWSRPAAVGPGSVARSLAVDLGGNLWALTYPDPGSVRLDVMTRSPGGAWSRDATFAGRAPWLVVAPLGEVVVSMTSAEFDHTWRLVQRDPVTGRWVSVPGLYAGSAATNRAGDIVSAHIHPIEQGNHPSAFIDRYVAPPRPELVTVQAPERIRRGARATVHATVSRPGPVLVTVSSGARRRIAASAVARRAGTVAVALPGRLTRLMPAGPARITVDTGGHDAARAVRSVRLSLTDRAPAPVRLTSGQLLVNQRIAQAAVRRSNAALAALREGLPAEAIRDGGLTARSFGPSVTIAGEPAGAPAGPGSGFRVRVAEPAPNRDADVTLSTAQLRINQRISQAAVRRANAVAERLAEGLTGRETADGAVTAAKLAPGLSVAATSGAPPQGPVVAVPRASGRTGGTVRLSAEQLTINQRISQAAVRRANASIAVLEAGLTDDWLAAGALSSRDLSPGLVP